jgi:putative DNA methylase
MTQKRKLIEVALPLDAINRESAAEKRNPFLKGHPRGIHHWWARRPLAACRAVLFAQLVDDPSARPEEFPTLAQQESERQRLFAILEKLVRWENRNSSELLDEARAEIRKSCGEVVPRILDPFAGGGSIPLEAQRLGLEALASDLNPVAVLINRAQIEIPSRWSGRRAVGPADGHLDISWGGARGLAADVKYYGAWMNGQAAIELQQHFPRAATEGGSDLPIKAWIWARTVTCPNPACRVKTPLARSFWLCKKKGAKAWARPETINGHVQFVVESGDGGPVLEGSVTRKGAVCVACSNPISFEYIRVEGQRGRLGTRLMATIAEGARRRSYLTPDSEQEEAADVVRQAAIPDTELFDWPGRINVVRYGITKHSDLFTNRQLLVLATFAKLVEAAQEEVKRDALAADWPEPDATEYSKDVATYLGMAVSRLAAYENSACIWHQTSELVIHVYSRQSIAMTWDFVETNPFGKGLDFPAAIGWITGPLAELPPPGARPGTVAAVAAQELGSVWKGNNIVVSTDPPYYDNIPYADVADLFYVWLKESLQHIHQDLFQTILTPKADELVANPYRLDGKENAERFFESGLFTAFSALMDLHSTDFPLTLFYAFKQSEEKVGDAHVASTGWETMLEGLLRSGFAVTATWPIRTELDSALKKSMSVLASSIVLACRPRLEEARSTDRRGFLQALREELPQALTEMQQGVIAPVDLAQASIGPGMAIFSRYAQVIEVDGSSMTVRAALTLINQVLTEVLSQMDDEFDSPTRWAISWFELYGMKDGPYGEAEVLAKAKGVAVGGVVEDGIALATRGRVQLVPPEGLRPDWNPDTDSRLRVWEVTHHLLRALNQEGEEGAASMLRLVGVTNGALARDLAYRLYNACERKRWTGEAFAYNQLVVAWPEIQRLAGRDAVPTQTVLGR